MPRHFKCLIAVRRGRHERRRRRLVSGSGVAMARLRVQVFVATKRRTRCIILIRVVSTRAHAVMQCLPLFRLGIFSVYVPPESVGQIAVRSQLGSCECEHPSPVAAVSAESVRKQATQPKRNRRKRKPLKSERRSVFVGLLYLFRTEMHSRQPTVPAARQSAVFWKMYFGGVNKL